MIHFRKTAAVWPVILCGALTSALAQQPDKPRPTPGTRPERPAPTPPTDEEIGATPRPDSPEQPSGRFGGLPGLSEEAKRSFREIPPGSEREVAAIPAPGEDAPPPRSPAPPSLPSRSAPPKVQKRPEYVVEPPDLLLVEVLEALPGRPISGERLVRPDGRIGLGFYGEIPVAGLTLAQIKERIVLHLRKYINDDILGLVDRDENGEYLRDPYGRVVLHDPRDTDRVFVDVTAYNSQNYYVLGEVALPGRLPYTGGDTVLDVIQYAGGLLPTADKAQIRLIRSFPKGSPAQVLPINYGEVTMGTDSSTNYAMLPNDRLVIPRIESGPAVAASSEGGPSRDARASRASASRTAPSLYFNRGEYEAARESTAELERRIEVLEKKLDRLIEMVEKNPPRPGGGPTAKVDERNPFGGEPEDEAMDLTPPRFARPAPGTGPRPGPQPPGPRRVGPKEPRPAPPRPRRAEPGGSRPEPPPFPRLPDEDGSPFEDLRPASPPER